MDPLIKHIEKSANRLEEEYRAALEKASTPQEIADFREGWFNAIVSRYLPYNSRITKSQIFDSYGNKSNSIDCVVLGNNHPRLIDAKDKYSFILAEGVDFVVEIKGKLTASELNRGLKQLESVKALNCKQRGFLDYEFQNLPVMQQQAFKIENTKIPCYLYFFESTMAIKKIIKKLEEFYKGKKGSEQVNAIILHQRFILKRRLNEKGKSNWTLWPLNNLTYLTFLFEINCHIVKSEISFQDPIIKIYLEKILETVKGSILFSCID